MELLRALSVQGRVISALTLRETRSRYGNSKLGFFWALFEPAAHVGVFIAIFSGLGRSSPIGESTGLFILTGIMPWLLFNNIVSKIMTGLTANKALLGYPQVMPMDITISRVILEFASLFLVMLFFIVLLMNTGITIKIDDFLELMKVSGLFVVLAVGVGLINASILHSTPAYGNIYGALSRPLYFMSGVFFTANFLSPEAFEILGYNPLLHLMDWFRSAFFPSFESDLIDKPYTITVIVIIFAIGLITDRATRKKARVG